MIKEFEDIARQYDIPIHILERLENNISGNGRRKVQLTNLQKQAFSDEKFWFKEDGNKNLIVQGATSSGKTLTAELLTLQCVFSRNKHVIYLVPLKALVSEKVQQFKRDILDVNTNINIFASSADYQDHDAELAEGQYDIAVVVYEKFFAMLAEQRDNKFLERCGLIIVDEIQLLSSQGRGAKLEYSLTKVINNFEDRIRVMGLTTVDCETEHIKKWLNAENIYNDSRPIGLKEKVISVSGKYGERLVPGENDENLTVQEEPIYGILKVDEKGKTNPYEKKKNLLHSLLKDIYSRDEETKVIIFASSRGNCKKLATEIAESKVFDKQDIADELRVELEKADDENERNLFWNTLLPYGVAYHSAALPIGLRDLIEAEFKRNDGKIRIVVATETLTIGMNLPADVMILFDNKVHRGEDGEVDIRPQEYKNYIGRAGRLGITDRIGESYLFVGSDTEIPFYWKNYVCCKKENITSALVNATERQCAPYYLNLLCKGKEVVFSKDTIRLLASKTLDGMSSKKDIETEKIISDLKKIELIEEAFDDEFELDDDGDEDRYRLTAFGEILAPYALSVTTCFQIKKYFRDGQDRKKEAIGLPLDYTALDLQNGKYLLDILYTVCKMEEVEKHTYPRLPEATNPNRRIRYEEIRKVLLTYLKHHEDKEGDFAFWPKSELKQICNEDSYADVNRENLNPLFRAILLLHWIKGELPQEIMENTGLKNTHFEFSTGDMARIGESSSYIVEAIAKCFFTNRRRYDNTPGALEHAFYSLSLRIKYGLNERSLIQVANRHVYGVTRSTIIRMHKEAKECGFENINLFIRNAYDKISKYMTKSQQREIIYQMRERYSERKMEVLVNKLVEDDILYVEDRLNYEKLINPRNEDWPRYMSNIFNSLGRTRVTDGYCVLNDTLVVTWVLDGEDVDRKRNLCIANVKNYSRILYVKREWDSVIVQKQEAYISLEYLCRIILEFMALSCSAVGSDRIGTVICEYLSNSPQDNLIDKGTRPLQSNIEHALRYISSSDSDVVNNEPPIDQYMDYYGYEHVDFLGINQGRASVHSVCEIASGRKYAVKQITIPQDKEEYFSLNEMSQNLYDYCNENNVDFNDMTSILATIQQFYSWYKAPVTDLDKAIEQGNRRKNQLKSSEHKDFYFCQSVVFAMEGYRRLEEVRIIGQLSDAAETHILKSINPKLIMSDYYDAGDLTDIDNIGNMLQSDLFFAMEEFDGSLLDMRCDVNTDLVKEIGKQICIALEYCHSKGILHRDIKPGNILYKRTYDGNKFFCLCDFGSATSGMSAKTLGVGTEKYMPPEAKMGQYSVQSDIYSLGKTLFSIWSQKNSSEGALRDVLEKAYESEAIKRYTSAKEFGEALQTL